jgi:DHA1 family multidrug resistance protein-like MFS transporter
LAQPAPAKGPFGRISDTYSRNRALTWACILIFANQLGFGSIVPVVPLYAQEFGVSATAIGLTIAVYGAARFLMNVPTAQIADRFGRRQALAAGGTITVVGNLVCALADTYWLFLGGRFIAGAGAAMVITGTQIVVTDMSVISNRGRMMAVYQGTFMFAVGLGPLPGGFLAEYFSLSTPFFMYSILGSVVALLAWSRIPETRSRDADGKVVAGSGLPVVQQLRILTAETGFLLVSIVSFTLFFARTGAIFNLVPTIGDNRLEMTPGQIGIGLAMISIVGLALAYPSGMLVDRFGRKSVIVPATLLSGASLTMFAFSTNILWFMLSCFVWAMAMGVSGPAPAAYAADTAPSGMTASAMGTFRMLADAGYIAGPLLLGIAADVLTVDTALYLTAGMVIIAGAIFAIFAPETYRRQK